MDEQNTDGAVQRARKAHREPIDENGERVIYTPVITLRNGRVLRAIDVGKKAFRLVVG